MRHSALPLAFTVAIGAALATGHQVVAEDPHPIAFHDFLKIVDATLCAGQKGWNQPCQPQQVTLGSAAGQPALVVTCPGCLTALGVKGTVATGKLRASGQGAAAETTFRTEAPAAGELASAVTRLAAHFNDRYFVQARRPRGLALDADALLVADFGTGQADGRVWRVPLSAGTEPMIGSVTGTAIADALPSVAVATNFQGTPFRTVVGITAARRSSDGLLALTNRITGKEVEIPELRNFPVGSLLRVPGGTAGTNGHRSTGIAASLADFETRFDPDRDGPECNPHDLAVSGGHVYATDAAGNSVIRIDARTGAMSLYAVFDEIPNPQAAPGGKATTDAVPTGLEFGPDGALYVASLGGFPFAPGTGRVLKLIDVNQDGDALDAGEQTTAVTGLTMAIDVTFDRDGTMYTAEHSLAFASQGPGRICRIESGRCAQALTERAVGPTSLVVAGGYAYYSQEFLGRVSRVPLAGVTSTKTWSPQ